MSVDLAAIRAAVYQHKLLLLHDVDLEDAEYVAMARHFGTPQRYFQSHYHHPEFAEIFVSNNVPIDGQRVGVAGTGLRGRAYRSGGDDGRVDGCAPVDFFRGQGPGLGTL